MEVTRLDRHGNVVTPISKKIITMVFVLLPWLSIYGTGISGVSFGDVTLIFACLYSVFIKGGKRYKMIGTGFLIFILYAVFCTMFVIIDDYININAYGIFGRFGKFALFVFSICYVMPRHFDYNAFKRYLRVFSLIAAYAIVIQYIAYYTTHQYVHFKLPFLNYCNDVAEATDHSNMLKFRASSIFLEPAHYTYFAVEYLVIALNDVRMSKKNSLVVFVFLLLCVLISGSSTGLLVAAMFAALYLVSIIVSRRKSKKLLRITAALLAVGVLWLLYTNVGDAKFSLERMTSGGATQEAVWGRTSSGEEEWMNLDLKMFGAGFGNTDGGHMNSIYYLLYCTGYIGLAVLLLLGIRRFVTGDYTSKCMLLIIAALCFSCPIIISSSIVPYYCIIYGQSDRFLQEQSEHEKRLAA